MIIPIISELPSSPDDHRLLSASKTLPLRIYSQHLCSKQSSFDSGSIGLFPSGANFSEIDKMLNSGLDYAIVEHSEIDSAKNDQFYEKIPASRLGLIFNDCNLLSQFLDSNDQDLGVSIVKLNTIYYPELDMELKSICQKAKKLRIIAELSFDTSENSLELSLQNIQALTNLGIDVCSAINNFTFEDTPSSLNKLPYADSFISSCGIQSDRTDGLYTTVVTDQLGVCLGLAYSNNESLKQAFSLQQGVYWSRKRGLWHKGLTSGATQELLGLKLDCDKDTLFFAVNQKSPGFCHNDTYTCFDSTEFGNNGVLSRLGAVLSERMQNPPPGSYTSRLFNDTALLNDKIMEEAEELCSADTPAEIAWEAADLLYFMLTKATANGVSISDIEKNLLIKSKKIVRRPGNSKRKLSLEESESSKNINLADENGSKQAKISPDSGKSISESQSDNLITSLTHVKVPTPEGVKIEMRSFDKNNLSKEEITQLLQRPIIKADEIVDIVKPIVDQVKLHGDSAIKEFTSKFDKVDLDSVVLTAPFTIPSLNENVKKSIDLAYNNIRKFHEAQLTDPITIETMPGVTCSRFSRPIERVGIYVPGGSAVLPSTALMLGIPAQVAGCSKIVIATPPAKDGSIAPEVLYVAHLIQAHSVVMAGGAQAIAAMAYGTETVSKVDKILGPGNQFVTCAKMIVQNDIMAMVSIDMPAGPSELLVIADMTCEPSYVASDLLSQAEHGPDSQVVLVGVNLTNEMQAEISNQLDEQANKLPRVGIIRHSIPKSFSIQFDNYEEAMEFSNNYAPEHLILQTEDPDSLVPKVLNAGSVFVGKYSCESCGDYASGTNHTLPTYGFARMYSGVNTSSFQKHITSQKLSKEGLQSISNAVMTLAEVEGLDAHRNAVYIRVKDN
ncbi:Histidine biosynthesis trifunctional protein [Smittium culicis]|uniref:Histidine biosynthesis trifunctional protein n=1 Tax=Smittium culicis TaxID=133412 RepID=A0A1R1YSI9_9FUNG|nr:Histidine biosynthesis trifunctional protein [Smittium culicis]